MDDKCTLAFTGDIAFSKYFSESSAKDFFDQKIIDFLQTADYTIANIEAPITYKDINTKRVLTHVTSPDKIKLLNMLGINIWNLGNNHILDCGLEGYQETCLHARANNIKTIGAGSNLEEASRYLIVGDELKIGLLTITYPWRFLIANEDKPGTLTWNYTDIIKARIEKLKVISDYVVLIVHGGDEFSNLPMPYYRELYLKFLGFGVDVIVGHHPHVPQNYEKIGNKYIFYSLGNFIFDTDYQRMQNNTDVGVLLKLCFSSEGLSFDKLFITIDRNKNRVGTTGKCDIFTLLSEEEYECLWPYEAKAYDKAHKNALLYRHKKFQGHPFILSLVKDVRDLFHKQGRIIWSGKLKAMFSNSSSIEKSDVYKYINSHK